MVDVAVVIVAAGRGSRAGEGPPKQYRPLGGEAVLTRTLRPFLEHPRVTAAVCAIHPDDRALYDAATATLDDAKLRPPTPGGATRQASVLRALRALPGPTTPDAICLVHDAARPFVGPGLIDRAVEAAERHGAAAPGVAVTDTIKRVSADGRIEATLDRATLRAAQTPQAFRLAPLIAAHARAEAEGLDAFTDDAVLMEWAGAPVWTFEGDPDNVKLTRPADFEAAESRLAGAVLVTRVSTGFDVHAFGPGDHVWLGGLKVPHAAGVVAHSDGDVVLHALTDALLGALADGDIGTHFPPSDPRWRGASSDRFLAFAAERVRARGGVIDFLDATVLCERPKIGPLRDTMRERIAAIAGVPADAVALKATTTERLGFTGRGEGVAAQAAATIRLPSWP